MADYFVIEELRSFLISQGIGHAQNESPSLTVPSVWLAPRDGAPEPRDGENITITLVDTQLAEPDDLEAYLETSYIDVIVRSRTALPGKLLQRQIRDLVVPIGAFGGRKLWTMGNLLVERSALWRADQPRGANKIAFDRVQSFVFESRRKALAGLPYAP